MNGPDFTMRNTRSASTGQLPIR